MATQKSMLSEFGWDQRYCVSGIEDVLTPALVMYPDIIAANLERTLELPAGDADRWRVHIRTAKWATFCTCWLSAASAISRRDHTGAAGGLSERRSRRALGLSRDGRECAPCTGRLRRADGVYRWFNSRALPLRDAKGRIVRWYNLLTDIDERKTPEEKAKSQ
jgi:hypothetical protein